MSENSNIRFGTTFGMRGYFAIMYDDDGPINSGIGSYKTQEGAAKEARDWAYSEFGERGKYYLDGTAREDETSRDSGSRGSKRR